MARLALKYRIHGSVGDQAHISLIVQPLLTNSNLINNLKLKEIFLKLECAGYFFAYSMSPIFAFLRDVWIRIQSAAVAARRISQPFFII